MGDKKKELEAVKNWLTKYLLQNVTDKAVEDVRDAIFRKAATKLGLNYAFEFTPDKLISKLPGVWLAKATIFGAKLGFFEGYFVTNGKFNWNPFDPAKQEGEYAEYLIYSWARGNPGYIYALPMLAATLKKH